jgi:hypothetical protein
MLPLVDDPYLENFTVTAVGMTIIV